MDAKRYHEIIRVQVSKRLPKSYSQHCQRLSEPAIDVCHFAERQ